MLDFASGRQLGVLLGHTRPVVGCASVPMPGRVVSWSLDRTIRLWDIENFQCVGTIYGHAPFISVSVVPATAGNGSTVPDAPAGPQMPVLVALDASGMVWLLTVSDGNVPASTSTRQA